LPTIRIDNEVWNALKRRAEPFEDTPNTVLRRLLRLDKQQRASKRLPTGERTPQSAYRIPILEVIEELGGSARANKVLAKVGRRMRASFRSSDQQRISSGLPRWKNAAMWERKAMVDDGLLSAESPRGIWELTLKGKESLRNSAA
jgi:restriction system protein